MRVLRIVVSSRDLRLVVAAFLGFNFADWARWLAVIVYAYGQGGASEAGVVSLLQLIPAAIAAPFVSSLGDRYPRHRVLLLALGSQAVLMTATGLALVAGAPSILVYGLAMLAVIGTVLTRPSYASLLPSLARTPDELTAASVASSWMEAAGVLSGPLVAGFVIEAAGSAAALLVAGGVVGLGAFAVAFVRGVVRDTGPSRPEGASLASELVGGFTALAGLPGPRTVVLVLGAAAMLWGAIDVLNVTLALDVMGLGSSGAGVLGASLGVGGIIGSSVAASLVGRPSIARAFVVGLLVWGTPLLGIAVLPVPLVAVTLMAVAGAGRSVMDAAGRLLLQRATPDAVLARVFGILEGSFQGAFGVGSMAVAGLIAARGPEFALVVAGLFLPAVVLVAWRPLRSIDRSAPVPLERLALLRGIPMFAALGPTQLEWLARDLSPVAVSAGDPIIREGEPGDCFYLVADGQVSVSAGGREIRTQGPGSAFGEIALLRDVPRTASVVALTDASLLALTSERFLEAVTGLPGGRERADAIATAGYSA